MNYPIIPKISVVIPAYNEEKYLPKCLESLKRQTFDGYEIIVVDNNSKDNTFFIAQSFGVKVIREKKQGIIPARERGFKVARGEILVKTDADTVLPKNWLSRIYKYFLGNPAIVALTGGFYFPETGPAQNKLLTALTNAYSKHLKKLMGHYPLMGPNYALRKSVWMTISLHLDDRLVHEDIDLSCHLSEHGEIKFYPELKVSYSLRRWKRKFWHTMYEYGLRGIKTIVIHHPELKKPKKLLSVIRKRG